MRILLLALLLALPVRAQEPPDAALPDTSRPDASRPEAALPEAALPTQVMALPVELRQRFHREVLATPGAPAERLHRTLRFILDPAGLGIAYEEDATYSVAQAYEARRANCLSFTLLFLVLADEAGLDAQAQEIANTLAWHQVKGTIYRNHHINARVRIGPRRFTIDSSGDDLVAGSQPQPISRERLLAHYYNNLAMQRMEHGHLATALQLMQQALDADAAHPFLWSNAGVLHVRNGDLHSARRAYERALAINPGTPTALLNMASLSRRENDAQGEAAFRRRLERVQQRDPLYQFVLGIYAERDGDLELAIRHYRSAIGLFDGEHRFHSALARAYLEAGNTRRAGRALRRAHALSDGSTRDAYAAQLQALRQRSRSGAPE
jgi:Flp pilus assembly protein TadD